MQKKYNISHDGVIYTMNPDRTITRYGRIDEYGRLTDVHGTPVGARVAAPRRPVRRRPVWGYWLVIILLLLAGAAGTYVFMRMYEEKARLESDLGQAKIKAGNDAGTLKQKERLIEQLQKELESVNRSRFEAEKNLSEICAQASAVTPLMVTGMEFRDMSSAGRPLSNFGAPLKAGNLHFLQAKVNYYGITTGMKTFNVRIIGPGGVMGGGDWSFSVQRPVESGAGHSFNFSGFGYSDRSWPSGSYRYEIWYGKSLIGVHSFRL